MESQNFLNTPSLAWDDRTGELLLLDQTFLPLAEKVLRLNKVEEVHEAISKLRVRGAPAIGIAAAFGLCLAVLGQPFPDKGALVARLKEAGEYLKSARPTAVNLSWAVDILVKKIEDSLFKEVDKLQAYLLQEAVSMRDQDITTCRQIGEHGLSLLRPGMGLLTHCNAGQLATIRYGTALAPIYLGHEKGYQFKVFADETRPLLQGARLTAYELDKAGVDITLICDNMAASIMAKGQIDAVLVGCDRVAANGDTANKIGTLNVAILANYFGIPFYVCAPYSTLDFKCASGGDIPIEERSGKEISDFWYEKPMAPENIKKYNPAFDVTPNQLITAFITEKGVLKPDFTLSLNLGDAYE